MQRTVPIYLFFIGGVALVNGLLAQGVWSKYVPLAIGSVALVVGILMLARHTRATARAGRDSQRRS